MLSRSARLGQQMQFDQLKRREFITLLGGAAAAWPLAASAQQAGKLPIIGLLGPTSAAAGVPRADVFVSRLRQLGWIEGSTVAIEYRWAEGRYERVAAEFVRLKVDVIVTAATAPVLAAKQATSVIPIVFVGSGDPVGSGLVASLARPGGNVTGSSLQQAELAPKRLEILREIAPSVRRLAIMGNVSSPLIAAEMREAQSTALRLGLEVGLLEIRQADDIPLAFKTALNDRADAVYVCADPLTDTNRLRIVSLAQAARLSTVFVEREFVEAGGLISYGPNTPDLFRRAAELVDKILRGTNPADLPVQQPTKFELVINLKTAKALGLDVPPMLLARADEVIE
jgi:putative tryptophan/tyrosine transport system substrate-binding protein